MKIESINTSRKKGEKKSPVEKCRLVKGKGVSGDAHFGLNELKQVSVLRIEDIREFEKTLLKGKVKLEPGCFGENLTVSGLPLSIKVGDRYENGKIILEVSKIGKECHKFCAIGKIVGKCIMPERGFFLRILKGDVLKKGENFQIIKLYNSLLM